MHLLARNALSDLNADGVVYHRYSRWHECPSYPYKNLVNQHLREIHESHFATSNGWQCSVEAIEKRFCGAWIQVRVHVSAKSEE